MPFSEKVLVQGVSTLPGGVVVDAQVSKADDTQVVVDDVEPRKRRCR